jgi:hypothetical protein
MIRNILSFSLVNYVCNVISVLHKMRIIVVNEVYCLVSYVCNVIAVFFGMCSRMMTIILFSLVSYVSRNISIVCLGSAPA